MFLAMRGRKHTLETRYTSSFKRERDRRIMRGCAERQREWHWCPQRVQQRPFYKRFCFLKRERDDERI